MTDYSKQTVPNALTEPGPVPVVEANVTGGSAHDRIDRLNQRVSVEVNRIDREFDDRDKQIENLRERVQMCEDAYDGDHDLSERIHTMERRVHDGTEYMRHQSMMYPRGQQELEKRVDKLAKALEGVMKNVDNVHQRVVVLGEMIEHQNNDGARLDHVNGRVSDHDNQVYLLTSRIAGLEARLNRFWFWWLAYAVFTMALCVIAPVLR